MRRVQDLPREEVGEYFEEVAAHVAWGGQVIHGSMISFDFGTPRLDVRESRGRRRAFVTGRWYLSITMCHWTIFDGRKGLATSDDDRTMMTRAVHRVCGQMIRTVAVAPRGQKTTFAFDQGSRIVITPYDDDPTNEQWNFSDARRNLNVELREDGRLRAGPYRAAWPDDAP